MRRAILAATVLALAFVSPVQADFESAYKAYSQRDQDTALREFTALAEQGDSRGQFFLGVMYDSGEDVDADKPEAAKWFLRSAEQGHPDAQQRLAFLYRNGEGVAKDYVKAHMWYSLAAGQGSMFAGIQRDLLANDMTPEQLADAQRLAAEWMAK